MGKARIAFVTDSYGIEVCGGAQYHCRVLAKHLKDKYDVDVITTCDLGGVSKDYYAQGAEDIDGITVRRFPVEEPDLSESRGTLRDKIRRGDTEAAEKWLQSTCGYSPTGLAYIKEHGAEYKAVIYMSYHHYLVGMGMRLGMPNAVLLSAAHDDAYIREPVNRDTYSNARAFLYNTPEERDFVYEHFHTEGIPHTLPSVGIEEPEYRDECFPQHLQKYRDNYILYAGSVSKRKAFGTLNRHFMEYKRRNPSDLVLIVAGRTDPGMQITASNDIVYAGFVTEDEKNMLMKDAKVLVNPSYNESLSLVLLESLMAKTPVLVNGDCEVMRKQCIRSNAGLYYTTYLEFEYALNYILYNKEAYRQMSANGYRFVKEGYDWNNVTTDMIKLIEGM